MLTKETMDKFLQWMKDNSDDAYKDKLAYGVRAGTNVDGYLMQQVSIYHATEHGNTKLDRDDKFLSALRDMLKQEKLNYYIYTVGAYYSEVFVVDPTNINFTEIGTATLDDEFTFSSNDYATRPTPWESKYGNLLFMPRNLDSFMEVA